MVFLSPKVDAHDVGGCQALKRDLRTLLCGGTCCNAGVPSRYTGDQGWVGHWTFSYWVTDEVQVIHPIHPSTIIIHPLCAPSYCAVPCCAVLYSTSTSLLFCKHPRYFRYIDYSIPSLRRLGRLTKPAFAISLHFIRFDDASCPSKASEIRSLSNSLCA